MQNDTVELRNAGPQHVPIRLYQTTPMLVRSIASLQDVLPEEKSHLENTFDDLISTKVNMRMMNDKCLKHAEMIYMLEQTMITNNATIAAFRKADLFDKMASYLSNENPRKQVEYCEQKAMNYLTEFLFFTGKMENMKNLLANGTRELNYLRVNDPTTYEAKQKSTRQRLEEYKEMTKDIVKHMELLIQIPFVRSSLKSCTDEKIKKAINLIPAVKKVTQQQSRNKGKKQNQAKQCSRKEKKEEGCAQFLEAMKNFTLSQRKKIMSDNEDLSELIRVRNGGAMRHYIHEKGKIEAAENIVKQKDDKVRALAGFSLEKSLALEWYGLIKQEAMLLDVIEKKQKEMKEFEKECMTMEYEWLRQLKETGKIGEFRRPVIPEECLGVDIFAEELVALRSMQQRAFLSAVNYFVLDVNPDRTEALTMRQLVRPPSKTPQPTVEGSPEPPRHVQRGAGHRRRPPRVQRAQLIPTVEARPTEQINNGTQ